MRERTDHFEVNLIFCTDDDNDAKDNTLSMRVLRDYYA